MVVYGEGRYACPEHGDQAPGARSREDAARVGSRTAARSAADRWTGRSSSEDRAPRPAQQSTPPARSRRSTTPPPGRASAGRSAIALRYHNVYGPGMPRDTPYIGVAAMFRSALERGEPPRVFEDGGQMRDFVHVDDVARGQPARR